MRRFTGYFVYYLYWLSMSVLFFNAACDDLVTISKVIPLAVPVSASLSCV